MRKIILLIFLLLTVTPDIYAGPRGRHRGHHKGWRHHPPRPPHPRHGRPPLPPSPMLPPHR